MVKRLRPAVFLGLTLCAALGGCAQYALSTDGATHHDFIWVEIADNIFSVREKLEGYLRDRGRIERIVNETGNQKNRIHLIQPWIRDSSLRYYMLEFDTRTRHLSEWKAQWTLESAGPMRTLIRMRVLELLYMGPPRLAGPRPNPPTEGVNARNLDWFEGSEDTVRAASELRRFYQQFYPLQRLPKIFGRLTYFFARVAADCGKEA